MNYSQEQLLNTFTCKENDPVKLSEKDVTKALSLEGETFLITLNYDEITKEFKENKIQHKILEALSILVCFEDDGTHFEDIVSFTHYIYETTEESQHFQFGIKKVTQLSQTPISLLLTGIHPINQLEIAIAPDLYQFIESKKDLLEPKFVKLRGNLSKKIGVPILPVEYYKDNSLAPKQVLLKDKQTNVNLCSCQLHNPQDKDEDVFKTIDEYLFKIAYAFENIAKS
jgi:hypothetical protein